VTGGDASTIDGLLRSEVGRADFFFINPAGVIFGPNAKVDVPAAFHVSTADALRFEDGNLFSASDPDASTLSVAEPAAFGYLSHQSGDIVLNGSRLELTPGSAVSLNGADVTIAGTETRDALVFAQEGEIRVAAVGDGEGELPVARDPEGDLEGSVVLRDGAIASSGYGGGRVEIRAGALEMENAVVAAENIGSDDATGGVAVNIREGVRMASSRISTATHADGDAGGVTLSAETLDIDGQGRPDRFTGISTQAARGAGGDAGAVAVTVSGRMTMRDGGTISSATFGGGRAGEVLVRAGELTIDDDGRPGQFTGIASSAQPDSTGDAGLVDLTVDGAMELRNGAQIHSATFSEGDAGVVRIQAGRLRIDDLGTPNQFTGISSEAVAGAAGNASTVAVTVKTTLEVIGGGQITSATSGAGRGGNVTIAARDLRIDGGGLSDQFTGIHSQANPGAGDDAGTVAVTATGTAEIRDGGVIGSATYGGGRGGEVTVRAGTLHIDGEGLEGVLTGITSSAGAASTGDAGSVAVTVDGRMTVAHGAGVGSVTAGAGTGGDVTVRAGELHIDGRGLEGQLTGITSSAQPDSTGDAGTVTVTVAGPLEMRRLGRISSDTFAQGHAGNVRVRAGTLRIDDGGHDGHLTGITSSTQGTASLMGIVYATGDAGTVDISVNGALDLIDGARISSETSSYSTGDAGNVSIRADTLKVDGGGSDEATGIDSRAGAMSLGHVGTVRIEAAALSLVRGGEISIAADQTLPADRLADIPGAAITIDAGRLHLDQGARITAESAGNVPAAPVNMKLRDLVVENGSRITTSANEADGGPITIQGETVFLRDGLVTTSVEGLKGDGGDIAITGPTGVLVLDGGFIQANTAAENARGGDIFIDAHALIASQGTLDVGGLQRQTFTPGTGANVIQAAAPGGESGTIAITAPDLDISGALVALPGGFTAPVRLATDPCRPAMGQNASSLVRYGKGGVTETPDTPWAGDIEVLLER
jgi:large exoprotein involved in heme utilization and adhesion